MIVIRRMVDRTCSYTGIFLPGEPPQIFPTTDYEHGRILQIYKQDKAYEGVVNDFSDDFALPPVQPAPTASTHTRQKKQPGTQHGKTRQKRRP